MQIKKVIELEYTRSPFWLRDLSGIRERDKAASRPTEWFQEDRHIYAIQS